MSRIVLRGGTGGSLWDRLRRNVERLQRVGLGQYAAEKRRRVRYIYQRLRRDSRAADAKWSRLAGKYAGQRAFLIGNGPSLNRTPLYLLRDEHKMCFNRFYLMRERLNWDIEFHAIVDNLLLNDMIGEMDALSANAEYLFLPDIHVRGEKYYEQVREYDNLFWMRHYGGGIGFSTKPPRVYGGGSVIYEGIQILRFLGFTEIALLGVDLRFTSHPTAVPVVGDPNGIQPTKDDDPNHFDPRYFGAGRSYHNPQDFVIDNIRSRLADVADVMPQVGFKVINIGYDSTVDSFARQDFEAYLGKTHAETLALFEDLIRQCSRYNSLDALSGEARVVSSADELRGTQETVVAPVAIAASLVGTKVLTHIALGPYNGHIYFVKRIP